MHDTTAQNQISIQLNLIERITGLEPTHPLAHLIVFAICIVSAIIFYFAGFMVLRKIRKNTRSEFLIEFRKNFKAVTFLLFVVLGVLIPFSIFNYKNQLLINVHHFFNISLIAILASIVIKSVHILRKIILEKFDFGRSDNLKARKVYTQFDILERIIIALVIIFAFAIALMTFEGIRKIGVSIFASAGVAGIILGLAAQKIIGSFLAGVQIAITQPIRIDDVIIAENEWGRIEEINLTYVVVHIWDKRRLVLPTTYFIEKPFQNWTRVTSELLGTVFIYTDYKVSYEALRKELTRLLDQTELWDRKVNVLQVTDATEKTVEIRALMSAKDSPTLWDLRVLIREKLLEFLQINYPESLPKSRVKIDGEK